MTEKRKLIKTRHRGIFFREHASRKVAGRPDRYFIIKHYVNGKQKAEGCGWLSEDVDIAQVRQWLNEIRINKKLGKGPRSLAEMRQTEKDKKTELEKDNLPFSKYAIETYFPIAKRTKKTKRIDSELNHINRWLNPVVGALPLKKIVPLNLEKVKKNMLDAGKAPRFIQLVFSTFRVIWNMAKRDGLVYAESPTKSVKLPKVNNDKLRYLTHEEAALLLEKIKARSLQCHDMALTALHVGARLGELFNLQWKDVHLTEGYMLLRDTKSGKNRPAFLTDALQEMFKVYGKGRPEEYVFTDDDGNKLEQLSHSFLRAVKDAKLNEGITDRRDRFSFHGLRHTFASWHVLAGTDLYTLQKLMGHSTPLMTQRYAHLSEGHLKAATANFSQSLQQHQTPESNVIPFHSSSV